MKYVAKPVEMEAIQFDGDNFGEIQAFVGMRKVDVDHYIDSFDDVRNWWVDVPQGITAVLWVEPSQQWAGVKPGDYICQDIKGDFYPCVKDIFENKYEPKQDVKVEVNFRGDVISSRDFAERVQQSRRFRG